MFATGQDLVGFNMFAYCGNNPVMGYDPTGEINWGGVLLGVGILALAVAAAAVTVATAGTASPLVAAAAVTMGTMVTATLLHTGAVTTYGALLEEPVVYDTTIVTGRERNGMSLVIDFEHNTTDLYAHTGAQTSDALAITCGTGIVKDYETPGQYAGEFVGGGVSATYKNVSFGVDYCTSPGRLRGEAEGTSAIIFTTGFNLAPCSKVSINGAVDYYWDIG